MDHTFHRRIDRVRCEYAYRLGLSVFQRKKAKVVSVYDMKEYRGSTGIAPFILNLVTDGGEWLT